MPNLNIKIINKSDVLYFDPFYKTAWVLKLQKYTVLQDGTFLLMK